MRKLCRYNLDKESSLNFFKESLEVTNKLSNNIIDFIIDHEGIFFTLLPNNANLEKLHQFSQSIFPEMPREKGPIGSLPGVYTYSKISSLEEEFSEYLILELTKNNLLCVIDNFNASYNQEYSCELFDKFGKYNDKEIYYFFRP